MTPLRDNEKRKHSVRLIKGVSQEISLKFYYFSALFFGYFFENVNADSAVREESFSTHNFKIGF
jgi:hypothetical protein